MMWKNRTYSVTRNVTLFHRKQYYCLEMCPKICFVSKSRFIKNFVRCMSVLGSSGDINCSNPSIATIEQTHQLVEKDMKGFYNEIQEDLYKGIGDESSSSSLRQMVTNCGDLSEISGYYLQGDGKGFRPMLMLLMARAINTHNATTQQIHSNEEMREQAPTAFQRRVAQICEMIHSASLIHDDVIDGSAIRRCRPTTNHVWGQRQAILAGDYILARASLALAEIGNNQVITLLSQVLQDLVSGEFMQLGTASNEKDRFNHYLSKTYRKTASLFSHTCKAMSLLSPHCQPDSRLHDAAYEYGVNVGMEFQIIDDILDFTSAPAISGKPSGADLLQGLATAPVLFAARMFPELNSLIMRRFSQPGDVVLARQLVEKSDGISESYKLASSHANQAQRALDSFHHNMYTSALRELVYMVYARNS